MPQSSVTAKGQITLPLAFRRKYDIHPKDLVTIEDTGSTIVIRKTKSIFELEGILGSASSVNEERESAMDGATLHALGDD